MREREKRIGVRTKGKVKEERREENPYDYSEGSPGPSDRLCGTGEKYNGGEKWELCEAYPISTNLKIYMILRFNFFTVNH